MKAKWKFIPDADAARHAVSASTAIIDILILLRFTQTRLSCKSPSLKLNNNKLICSKWNVKWNIYVVISFSTQEFFTFLRFTAGRRLHPSVKVMITEEMKAKETEQWLGSLTFSFSLLILSKYQTLLPVTLYPPCALELIILILTLPVFRLEKPFSISKFIRSWEREPYCLSILTGEYLSGDINSHRLSSFSA